MAGKAPCLPSCPVRSQLSLKTRRKDLFTPLAQKTVLVQQFLPELWPMIHTRPTAMWYYLGVALSCASGVMALSASIPIHGGKYTMNWISNITVPLHPGFAQLPESNSLIVTTFEGTPFVGKHGVFMMDPTTPGSKFVMLPGSDNIDWPNAVTTVDSSVFGFPAIILGNGFLYLHTLKEECGYWKSQQVQTRSSAQ